MAEKKFTFGMILSAIAAVMIVVATILYGGVQNRESIVYTLLIAAVVISVLALAVEAMGKHHKACNLVPGVCAVLVMIALALAFRPMVQQIAWSFSGLDSMDVISQLINFEILSCATWLVLLVNAFVGYRKS